MTRKTVDDVLKELGDCPDAVAYRLLHEECHGVPYNRAHCPVARYINKTGVTWSGVYVGQDYAYIPDPQICGRWSLPEPVREFVQKFDGGYYKELRKV